MTALSAEFPLDEDLIYLNHAAVAPWPRRTADAVNRFTTENLHRGAAAYPEWMKQEKLLRGQLQQLINAPSADDIALVKNTSEALSFVASGLEWKAGDNVVSSNEEFPSNRMPWQALANQGVEFREADLANAPDSPEQALLDLVDENTRLLTVSSIQFSTGLRLDLERLGRFCRNHGILFCVDAIQSIGAVDFDVQACQADFVMADGHKWMLGPEGLALFYSRPESRDMLRLTQFGWHMRENPGDYSNSSWQIARSARRFECGSPNMLGIHALSASISLLLETGMSNVESQLLARSAFIHEYLEHNQFLTRVNTAATLHGKLSGITVFRHRQMDTTALYDSLMKKHHVICAMRGGGIRFSPHFYTPYSKIEQALMFAATPSPF